jgi:hypothetical protein
MSPFDRLHRLMPFVIMLYLLTSLAQTHVTRPFSPLPTFAQAHATIVAEIKAGVHWYAAKIGEAEANDIYCLPTT